MSLKSCNKSFFTMGNDIPYGDYLLLQMKALYHGRKVPFFICHVDHFVAYGTLTKAVMKDHKTVFVLDDHIGRVALHLPGNHLDRCHKSSIANLHYIAALLPDIAPHYLTLGNEIMNISKHEMNRVEDIMFCFHPQEGVRRRRDNH